MNIFPVSNRLIRTPVLIICPIVTVQRIINGDQGLALNCKLVFLICLLLYSIRKKHGTVFLFYCNIGRTGFSRVRFNLKGDGFLFHGFGGRHFTYPALGIFRDNSVAGLAGHYLQLYVTALFRNFLRSDVYPRCNPGVKVGNVDEDASTELAFITVYKVAKFFIIGNQ